MELLITLIIVALLLLFFGFALTGKLHSEGVPRLSLKLEVPAGGKGAVTHEGKTVFTFPTTTLDDEHLINKYSSEGEDNYHVALSEDFLSKDHINFEVIFDTMPASGRELECQLALVYFDEGQYSQGKRFIEVETDLNPSQNNYTVSFAGMQEHIQKAINDNEFTKKIARMMPRKKNKPTVQR